LFGQTFPVRFSIISFNNFFSVAINRRTLKIKRRKINFAQKSNQNILSDVKTFSKKIKQLNEIKKPSHNNNNNNKNNNNKLNIKHRMEIENF
jgi:hypothetical protein